MKTVIGSVVVIAACALMAMALGSCQVKDEPTSSGEDNVQLCQAHTPSPADDDTIYQDSVLLGWDFTLSDECGPPTRYSVHVVIGDEMTDFDLLWSDLDTCTINGLTMDTVFYWWVVSRTTEAGFDTAVSDTWCYYTNSELSGTPYDPSPAHEATEVDINTDLDWSVHNPLGETYHYDVHLGTTASPPLEQPDLSVATYEPNQLLGGTTYFWQVVAFTAGGDTTRGPVWQFTTSSLVPIYGLFEVDCHYMTVSYHYEELRARFDSVYAPDAPVTPITEYTVEFVLPDASTIPLTLNPTTSTYTHFETSIPFLELGETYNFSVTRSPNTFELTLPDCAPDITRPEALSTVYNSGFDVEWTGTGCGGNVWITMIRYSDVGVSDSAGIWVNTENDGSYTMTTDDLSGIASSYMNRYDIVVIKQVEIPVVAASWLEESLIRIRIYDKSESVTMWESVK